MSQVHGCATLARRFQPEHSKRLNRETHFRYVSHLSSLPASVLIPGINADLLAHNIGKASHQCRVVPTLKASKGCSVFSTTVSIASRQSEICRYCVSWRPLLRIVSPSGFGRTSGGTQEQQPSSGVSPRCFRIGSSTR